MDWDSYTGSKPLIIGAFYRPPKSPVTNLEHLTTFLADIQTKFKNAVVIVAGDFNLADIDWSDRIVKPYAIEPLKCAALLDLCNEFFFDQMVTEPTRISGVTKNILDLVLTSHPNFIDQCKVVPGVSDHEAVTFMLNLKPKFNKKPARKCLCLAERTWPASSRKCMTSNNPFCAVTQPHVLSQKIGRCFQPSYLIWWKSTFHRRCQVPAMSIPGSPAT